MFLTSIFSPLRSAVVTGRVMDGATQQSIDGANIVIARTDAAASSATNGGFTIGNAPVGKWVITASHIGYLPDNQRIHIKSAADTLQIDFNLYEHSIPLDEVVFTATRTLKTLKSVPVSTELITRADFERSGAITAADALSGEIGYEVREDFSGRGVMLQGADPDKVLILVDGNRIIGRVNGSIDLEQISVGNVKQIEVVKGAVSTLYGSEAIGGVINIITDKPSERFRMQLDLSGGGYTPDSRGISKFGFQSTNFSQGLSFGANTDRLSLGGSGRFARTGLIDIDPSTRHTEGIDATDRINGDLRLQYRYSDIFNLILSGRGFSEDKSWEEDAGLQSVNVSYDDRENNSQIGGSVELLCTPTSSQRYSAKVYHTDNYHRWEKWTQSIWGPPQVRDFSEGNEDYTETSLLITHSIANNHQLTLGGDLYFWNISSDARLGGIRSTFNGDLTAGSAFMQNEWQMTPKWTFLPGLRYEVHEIYGSNWSPRLSTMFTPRSDIRFRISAGQGYRAPSSKELYFVFNHASAGYIVYGNPDLRPEHSTNYSVSIEHNYRNTSIARITFFHNDLYDLIDFDSTGVSEDYYTGIFSYNNLLSAWTRGIEIERGFIPANGLEIKLAYGYMESRNNLTGNALIRRPKHSGRWDITYRKGAWTSKIWGRYTGRAMFQDIFHSDAQSTDEWSIPYQLWNIALTREIWDNTSVYLKIENLLDKTHPRYGPREGRVVTLGGKWSFKQ